MGSHAEANTYLNDLNLTVKPLAVAAHEAFGAEGCSSYVKTIYIGDDIDGEMVAALYGHADHIEVGVGERSDGQLRWWATARKARIDSAEMSSWSACG